MLLARGFGALPSHHMEQAAKIAQTAIAGFAGATATRQSILERTRSYKMEVAARVAATRAKLESMRGMLSSCAAMSLDLQTQMGTCSTSARNDAFKQNRYMRVPDQSLLDPPGVIEILGIGFLPTELREGNWTHPDEPTFERSLVPNQGQRWIVDQAVYVKSQLELARIAYDVDLSGRENLDAILADPSDASGLVGLLTRSVRVQVPGGAARVDSPSITAFQTIFRTSDGRAAFVPGASGYGLNSITPTPDEMDKLGGLLSFYRRGGFLLSTDVLAGRVPVYYGALFVSTGFCISPCQKNVANYGTQPNKIVAIRRALQHEGGRGWLAYATVRPTDYVIRAQAKEKGDLARIRDFVGNTLAKLPGVLCAAAPSLVGINSSTMLAELCVDKLGNACKKGSKDCTCTSPTWSQTGMVAAANAGMTLWCGQVQGSSSTPPAVIPPSTPEPFPWGWVIAGLAVAGVVYASRK